MREREQHCSGCAMFRLQGDTVKCLSQVRLREKGSHEKTLPVYGPTECKEYYPKPSVRVAEALEGFLSLAHNMLSALDEKEGRLEQEDSAAEDKEEVERKPEEGKLRIDRW